MASMQGRPSRGQGLAGNRAAPCAVRRPSPSRGSRLCRGQSALHSHLGGPCVRMCPFFGCAPGAPEPRGFGFNGAHRRLSDPPKREWGEAARQRRLATCLISTAARSLGSSSCTSCTPSVAGRRPRMLARLAACSSTKPSNCCGCCTAVDWPFSAVAQVGQKRARVAGRRRIVTKIEAAPVYRSYCGPCLLVGRLPAINLACGVRAGVIIINYSDPPTYGPGPPT